MATEDAPEGEHIPSTATADKWGGTATEDAPEGEHIPSTATADKWGERPPKMRRW